jgi:hypothetical protein
MPERLASIVLNNHNYGRFLQTAIERVRTGILTL